MEYAERLTVPLRWWVQGTMLLATFWLALVVAVPPVFAWTATGVLVASMAGGFAWYGAARIVVGDGELRAGRAHIPLRHVGTVEPLDTEAARRAFGVEADARAHLVLRPYAHRAVRIEVTDPADPTPYWLVSTRHPDHLAAALSASGQ